ncbi:T9SS type A sorting domain-containing protein [Candidatus Pacearchaeota archaeon]|nr:T9SS type A sorting domain-containing protein [Candidatus Pacearchaeota archaeon]
MKKLSNKLSLSKKIAIGTASLLYGVTSLFGGQQGESVSNDAWNTFYNSSKQGTAQSIKKALPSLESPDFNQKANSNYWDTPIDENGFENNFSRKEQSLEKIAETRDYGEDDILNPHAQPGDTLTNAYGSGDVNLTGEVSPDDATAAQNGVQNYQSDVDGDGIPSSATDITQIQNFTENVFSSPLPGHWNSHLGNPEAKDNWVSITSVNVDSTSAIPYHDDNPENRWISGNYAAQIYLNYFGYDGDDIPVKYDTTQIGKFNLPMYWVNLHNPITGIGHGMNAFLVGNDPTNIYHWRLFEPQTDEVIEINETVLNNISGKRIKISGIQDFSGVGAPDMPIINGIIGFDIDSSGNSSIYSQDSELILNPGELPTITPDTTVGIDKKKYLPEGYNLQQNYPNPFNSQTNIKYSLPVGDNVSLNVRDIRGSNVKTLVNKVHHEEGNYKTSFDASGLSSGMYFIEMNTDKGFKETIKAIYVK